MMPEPEEGPGYADWAVCDTTVVHDDREVLHSWLTSPRRAPWTSAPDKTAIRANGGPPAGNQHTHLTPIRASPRPALEISKRPSPIQRIRHLWQYRELLGNLVRKELKVKYKNSVLGFVWSLLNPADVPGGVLVRVRRCAARRASRTSAIFFLSGLLAVELLRRRASWAATAPSSANAQLVTKVWFPRESAAARRRRRRAGALLPAEPRAVRRAAVFTRAPDVAYLPLLLLGDDRAARPHVLRWRSRWRRSTCTCATPSTCWSWCCWPGSGSRPSSIPTPDRRRQLDGRTSAPPLNRARCRSTRSSLIVITFQQVDLQPGRPGVRPRLDHDTAAWYLGQPRASRRCSRWRCSYVRPADLQPARGQLRRGDLTGARPPSRSTRHQGLQDLPRESPVRQGTGHPARPESLRAVLGARRRLDRRRRRRDAGPARTQRLGQIDAAQVRRRHVASDVGTHRHPGRPRWPRCSSSAPASTAT